LLPGGATIGQPEALFPQLEAAKPRASAGERASPKSSTSTKERVMISFKEFQKLDLRVGEIVSAERVPNADKLLKLSVDVGDETRTMVAGIALSYKPEELVGRSVVVVANLEPATIRGVRSEGMILAGWVEGDDESISIVAPDRPVPKGSVVS
jgi:methionyl-tRNA synthetase